MWHFFQGVFEFSMCLFFSKLVSYTFLFWLPTYIKDSGWSRPYSIFINFPKIASTLCQGGIRPHDP
jgi:hypothetical protein